MKSDVLKLVLNRMTTPIGELQLVTDRTGRLRAADWSDHDARMLRLLSRHYGQNGFSLEPARNRHEVGDAMERYFAGDVAAIEGILVQTGGTLFQRRVWDELRKIPCGTAISYGRLAERIAHPKAVRAVGLANGANPVGIVIPCHRVVGANGSLTGYGGGLERKQWLLEHERKHS